MILGDGAQTFEERLGHEFGDNGLLVQALTHRSWCAENPGEPSNERLELLGDAVLDLVVTEYAFESYPAMPEGGLAKTRAEVVSSPALAKVAQEVRLGAELRLGRGEERSGGREKPSILADAMEAVIGAAFVDGGYDAARHVVLGLFAEHVDVVAGGDPGGADFKTRLQELVAQRFGEPPHYELTREGPPHEPLFSARVLLGEKMLGVGKGRSKKAAEQAAAEDAHRRLVVEGDGSDDA